MMDAIRVASLPLPKRCIFCQGRSKLTREDFFPKWFREFYPAPPGSESARLNAEVSWHERDTATGEIATVMAPSKLARPGDLADQTLRVVCAKCNNGWMSRLQQTAKPYLRPYILGKWPRPDQAARKTISSWAVMFAMVVEFGDEASAVVPPIEREVFRRDLRPPIGAHIWAGRAAGDLPYWFHRRAMRVTLDPADDRGAPNAQLTTLTLGHLLLQVYLTTSDHPAFDGEQRADSCGLSPLWPLGLKGPGHHRARILNEAAVRDFAYRHLEAAVARGFVTAYVRHESGLFAGGRD